MKADITLNQACNRIHLCCMSCCTKLHSGLRGYTAKVVANDFMENEKCFSHWNLLRKDDNKTENPSFHDKEFQIKNLFYFFREWISKAMFACTPNHCWNSQLNFLFIQDKPTQLYKNASLIHCSQIFFLCGNLSNWLVLYLRHGICLFTSSFILLARLCYS